MGSMRTVRGVKGAAHLSTPLSSPHIQRFVRVEVPALPVMRGRRRTRVGAPKRGRGRADAARCLTHRLLQGGGGEEGGAQGQGLGAGEGE